MILQCQPWDERCRSRSVTSIVACRRYRSRRTHTDSRSSTPRIKDLGVHARKAMAELSTAHEIDSLACRVAWSRSRLCYRKTGRPRTAGPCVPQSRRGSLARIAAARFRKRTGGRSSWRGMVPMESPLVSETPVEATCHRAPAVSQPRPTTRWSTRLPFAGLPRA